MIIPFQIPFDRDSPEFNIDNARKRDTLRKAASSRLSQEE